MFGHREPVLTRSRGEAGIRVLVAIGEEYRSYREVIAASIRLLRPHVEVMSTGLDGLKQDVASFDPQFVISNLSRVTVRPSPIAWVRVSTEPTTPSEIWMWEDRWEATEPTVSLLAQIIDNMEEKVAPTENPGDLAPLREGGSGSGIKRTGRSRQYPERANRR